MINFYEEYKKLDELSICELKNQLELRGGSYMFPDGGMPIVTISHYSGVDNLMILSVGMTDKGDIVIIGHVVEGEDGEFSIHDVEGSHIHYIWEYMDDIESVN